MSAAHRVWMLAGLALLHTATAAAQDVVHPWQRLGASLERIYGWPNLLFHVSAATATPPLAVWVDEPVQESFQKHDPLGNAFGPVTLVTGGILPIVGPSALYLGGLAADDAELASAGAATVQAVVTQALVVTSLKWLTDRAGPYPNGDPSERRWSGGFLHLRDSKSATDFDFNPFDLEGGLRWPSGHTASAMAMVSSLVAFYPTEPWLALVGYPLVLAIGVGMIEGDYHWLSDVVAGALIGHVIGWQVGREFRATFDARRANHALSGASTESPRVALVPTPFGLSMSGAF